MSAFPTKPVDRLAMAACYLCTAALFAMAMFPRACAQFLIGVLP
jgi:hypothetical protein